MRWFRLSTFRAAVLAGLLPVLAFGCVKPKPSGPPPTQKACTDDASCGTGNVCINGVCAPAAVAACGPGVQTCMMDTDCVTLACQSSGCCALACQTDNDCPDGQLCHSNVCDDSSGCRSSADCPYSGAPVCNTTTGVCVLCVTNDQCPAGDVCMNGGCQSVTPPGGCQTNNDCATTVLPFCDTQIPPAGRCVACIKDTDCSMDGSSLCDQNVCRAVNANCSWDGDCTGNTNGPHCAADGHCVECVHDDQCPMNSICLPDNQCTGATMCASDAACPPDKPKCRPTDHLCVECYTNPQCASRGPGNICRNGYCEPSINGCISNSECTVQMPVCDTTTRKCTECVSNSDCGAFCTNGVCTPCMKDLDCQQTFVSFNRLFCNANGDCVQCIGNGDCSDPTPLCNAGTCIADPTNQPCPSDGTCLAGLVCVPDGSATGTCRTPCDIYSGSNNCQGGTACGLIGFQAGAPVGACVARVSGAVQLGGACSATMKCDVDGECVPDGPGTAHCYNFCDPNANQTCGGGNKCQYVVEVSPTNVPISVGVCFPSSTWGDSCTANGDCGSNQNCSATANPSDAFSLWNACSWNAGTGGPGAPCTHPTDCQSGDCVFGMPNGQGASGFCQGACTADSMCPQRPDSAIAGACEPYPLPWHDRQGHADTESVVSCVPQCRDNSECPTGLVCDVVANSAQQKWVTRCRPKGTSGTGLGGASCLQDADCVSNHCLTIGFGSAGICAGVCTPSTASQACDPSATCPVSGVTLQVGPGPTYASAPICWGKSCTNNGNCGPTQVCAANPDPTDPTGARIVLACQPKEGAAPGGATCTSNAQCQSNYCVLWSGGSRCFGACNPANTTDCATGSTCFTGNWPDTMESLSYCAPQ